MNKHNSNSETHILVLHEALAADARSDELDALVQVEQVRAALLGLGFEVTTLATGLDLERTRTEVTARQPACIFNLVESLGGQGRLIHLVPALLEAENFRLTGSGSDTIYLSSQKQLAKRWMRRHGIATPPGLNGPGIARADADRWIVKSLWEHASFGLDDGCVVTGSDAARARIEHCRRAHGGDWFAERYIEGREFNISVLEVDGQPRVLPFAEMTFRNYPGHKPRIVGYAAKWDEQAPEYHSTVRQFPVLSGSLFEHLRDTVLRCWHGFGLRGYARVDLRLDAEGTPWVLEVNANPCLAQDAGFAVAADEAGITYAEVIARIVHAALPDLDYSGIMNPPFSATSTG